MKFSADRETLLAPLQAVMGVVERKQTMPVLANVLLAARNGRLTLTGTDLEVELVATTSIELVGGETTVPGRKLLDIVRALPEKATISFVLEGDKATVKAGRSRFSLATLPASDFPTVEDIRAQHTVALPASTAQMLLDKTHFSMAQQDVRYYLNGMLLELDGETVRSVATDGHRLAYCECKTEMKSGTQQVIIPRKGVIELQRLLSAEGTVELLIGASHVRVQIGDIRFTSKLIDGRFPDYGRVIPNSPPRLVRAERELLRAALQRAAILSNEKFRGIRLTLKPNLLQLQAHNPEQEEAEEELEVSYAGEEMEIGFNVNYLLDALAAVVSSDVELGFMDSNSSCLVLAPGDTTAKYVVMPMRL
jgi:DNA polymerase III subunit beta